MIPASNTFSLRDIANSLLKQPFQPLTHLQQRIGQIREQTRPILEALSTDQRGSKVNQTTFESMRDIPTITGPIKSRLEQLWQQLDFFEKAYRVCFKPAELESDHEIRSLSDIERDLNNTNTSLDLDSIMDTESAFPTINSSLVDTDQTLSWTSITKIFQALDSDFDNRQTNIEKVTRMLWRFAVAEDAADTSTLSELYSNKDEIVKQSELITNQLTDLERLTMPTHIRTDALATLSKVGLDIASLDQPTLNYIFNNRAYFAFEIINHNGMIPRERLVNPFGACALETPINNLRKIIMHCKKAGLAKAA